MCARLGFTEGDYKTFNHSLGIDTQTWKESEAWQILTATRTQHFGTDDLDRLIQFEYKRRLILAAKGWKSGAPRPFGDQEIVITDKVIQIANRSIKAWPRTGSALDYVANGEIGIVRNTTRGDGGRDCLDVVF
jgi:ATP-dependent exoDNAse (exonuclease V) alpha subunit